MFALGNTPEHDYFLISVISVIRGQKKSCKSKIC
jgi:hypothetical protein